MSHLEFIFSDVGDFAAVNHAVRFLTDNGFSVGRMQAHSPRGILYGNFAIQKWRNLSADERDALHGTMEGGREGPVTVKIFGNRCPSGAFKLVWNAKQ